MKLLLLIGLLVSYCCSAQNVLPSNSKLRIAVPSEKIIIELQASPDFFNKLRLPNDSGTDSIVLQSAPVDFMSIYREWDHNVSKVSNGRVKWAISSDKPLLFSSLALGTVFALCPGDSVQIIYNDNSPLISGISNATYKLQLELQKVLKLKGPTKHPLYINSLEDYFAWISHLNKNLDLFSTLLSSYKDKVTPSIYQLTKQLFVDNIEVDRTSAFNGLYNLKAASKVNLTFSDLSNIWDSTQSNAVLGQWLRSQPRYYVSAYYLYDFNRLEVRRKFNFDFTKDTIKHKKLRVEAYYNHAKTKYTGHVLDKLLQYIVSEEIVTELGPTDNLTQKILEDYQSISRIEYIDWMNKFIKKRMTLRVGKPAPDFVLTDRHGNKFIKNDLKNKIALFDFWFTGCAGCKQMTPALKKIEDIFKNDTNVVLVSISIDKDKKTWEKSISEGKYTTSTAMHFFTGGNGNDHAMIKLFDVSGYPELVLIDGNGKIIANPVPDPRSADGMKDLVNLIQKESLKLTNLASDGPYILYNRNLTSEYRIEDNTLQENNISNKKTITFNVKTDQPNVTFNVSLKSLLQPEKSEYIKPQKIFAVSDIEGKFESFRKLLQNSGVIDDNFNWIFGEGHLVITGDVFDRGGQVTECLWLIYDLEEKAKARGGYVHFILGNHEIMNLKGDHKYAIQKYKDNANKIGKPLVQLYNENSELGRWLRTKNIIEKIGDLLFVHGGIAPAINRIPLSIEEINNLARPYYDATNLDTLNKLLLLLYNDQLAGEDDKTSPFWFRGYYAGSDNPQHIPTTLQVDSTLQKFDVKRIVTGHTIVADTISIFYNGKVVNIDTPHALGNSEALLIEESKYFRVDMEGKKVPLYIFDGPKITTHSK